MSALREVITGGAWGDSGKGKIVDERIYVAKCLNNKRIIVLRYNGGPNAGHSVFFELGGKLYWFATHAAPSGVVQGTDLGIGSHVALDPKKFLREVSEAREKFGFDGRIMISDRAGVLMDYHQKLDAWWENLAGANAIGTTKSGIGPFYADNARRSTRLTFADYVSDQFPDRLREILELKETELFASKTVKRKWLFFKKKGLNDYLDKLVAEHDLVRRELRPFAENLEYRLQEYMRNGDNVILETAQGTGLDVDQGTLPDVSSSHVLAPQGLASLGLSRKDFTVYLVEKVYDTRVGNGVLPTLMPSELADRIVECAGEKGVTTGRRRRPGYPDWVMELRSILLNDADGVYLTRADIVQDTSLLVCTAYSVDGKDSIEVPLDLRRVTPVYGENAQWHLWGGPKDLSRPVEVHAQLRDVRREFVERGLEGLTGGLRDYVDCHNEYMARYTKRGCPIVGIGIGPARGETIVRKTA
ncbi:MAG: adenylosuccinate synthetase [Nanoarchaeota archaeon]